MKERPSDASTDQHVDSERLAARLSTYVVVVGQNAAGKSSVARILSSRLELGLLEFGDCVRQEMAKDPSLSTDPSAAYIELRRRRGAELLATWATQLDQTAPRGGLVLVGVRDIDSYRVLERRVSPMHTVAVVATPQARFDRDRRKSRQRGQTPLEEDEFRARDRLHASWGLPAIVAEANWRIDNDGNENSLSVNAVTVASMIMSTPS